MCRSDDRLPSGLKVPNRDSVALFQVDNAPGVTGIGLAYRVVCVRHDGAQKM